jgi:hypothetical protein
MFGFSLCFILTAIILLSSGCHADVADEQQQNRDLKAVYDTYVLRRRAQLKQFRDIVSERDVVRAERARDLRRDLNDPKFAAAYARHITEEEREELELQARHARYLAEQLRDGHERFRVHMRHLGVLPPAQPPREPSLSEWWGFDAIGVATLAVLSLLLWRSWQQQRPPRRKAMKS